MKYERPMILASFSVAELVKEAAVCHRYGGGDGGCWWLDLF